MTQKLKDGTLILEEVRVSEKVPPGNPMSVEVVVTNGAVSINTFDKDEDSNPANPCGGGTGSFDSAWCIEPKIVTEWDGKWYSLGVHSIESVLVGTNTVTYRTTVEAPTQNDTYQVGAIIDLPGSGTSSGIERKNFVVSDEATSEPIDRGNDNNNNNNGKDIVTLLLENPVGSIALAGASSIALRQIFGGE